MTTIEQNMAAALRCAELFNQCTLDWVDTCYAENFAWIELPQPATPNGRRGDRAYYRQVAQQMLTIFPDRQMVIRNMIAQGDQVVLEIDWTGTAAVALGPLQPGSKVRLKVANFLTFEEGLIVKQVDYCITMPHPES